MKKVFFILASVSFICSLVFSQNKLHPIWKITGNTTDSIEVSTIDSKNWKEINLLLSWERQGYSWQDEHCAIVNHFKVGENERGLKLQFSLQADVKAVYVNNHKVGGDIPNSFWSERGKETLINIPDSVLKRDDENQLLFLLANLSYTGGVSHNICALVSDLESTESKVELEFPTKDHVYLGDAAIRFVIRTQSQQSGQVELIINDDFHKNWVNDTFNVELGTKEIRVDASKYNLVPGFYECSAILDNGTYVGTAQWFAVNPEEIICTNKTIDGFDAYWQEALSELKEIVPNFKMHRVDSLCSTTREGYVVEMSSLGNLIIRGYYFVPKADGKYPVVLHLPGYGYGFEHLNGFINREGNVAELALCVRGHGISNDVFNPWPEMTLWAVNCCSKDSNVYRSIYMDCVRAVDFLLSRPEIDTTKIGVAGGSQGGGLTLATAGLCQNTIAACAIFDPFLCDTRDQMKIRTIVKRELESFTKYPENNCNLNQILNVQDYIDTKGFTGKIKCPIYFAASLFDDDCPVRCGFSAFNEISTVKSYEIFPSDSHLGESGQYDKLFYRLVEMLKK